MEKDPPREGGGAVYLQTRPSHACVESKEEVNGVLGALREPRTHVFCIDAKPLAGGGQWGHAATAPIDDPKTWKEEAGMTPPNAQTPPAHPGGKKR